MRRAQTFERCEQVLRLQRFRAKGCNAATCLLMAVANQITGQIQLLKHSGTLIGDSIANCLQLESDAGKALRQRVVHFMGHALAFFKHALQAPMRDAMVDEVENQGEQQSRDNKSDHVARAPPWRTSEDFKILIGAQEQDEGCQVSCECGVYHADAAQAETAVQFELAEKIIAAPWIHDGAERLRPFIEVENERVFGPTFLGCKASVHFNEGRVVSSGRCLRGGDGNRRDGCACPEHLDSRVLDCRTEVAGMYLAGNLDLVADFERRRIGLRYVDAARGVLDVKPRHGKNHHAANGSGCGAGERIQTQTCNVLRSTAGRTFFRSSPGSCCEPRKSKSLAVP